MVEEFLICVYGRYKRVVGNISTSFSGLGNGCIVIVENGVILDELHDGSVRLVYTMGCLDGRIHGDPALFPYGRHGEDVREQFWIVPHAPKILEVSNEG